VDLGEDAVIALVLLLSMAQVEKGEEVEVTSGAVTALSCALSARGGQLDALNACPLAEAVKEIVVFDVAERQVYRISTKAVFRFELEQAYAGGAIDFSGVVVAVDPKSGVATVDVTEYSVTPRPKAGAFKGCL
jgi:hypothetical protein